MMSMTSLVVLFPGSGSGCAGPLPVSTAVQRAGDLRFRVVKASGPVPSDLKKIP